MALRSIAVSPKTQSFMKKDEACLFTMICSPWHDKWLTGTLAHHLKQN